MVVQYLTLTNTTNFKKFFKKKFKKKLKKNFKKKFYTYYITNTINYLHMSKLFYNFALCRYKV